MTGVRTTKSARERGAGSARDVQFTNLNRVVFPASGYTKGDVLEYYAAVAELLLPHLRDRPVTLERLPEGVGEKAPRFWQKNTPAYYPKFIPRVNFPTADDGKPVHYAIVNDLRSLLYLANQNVLTFHTWLSRAKSPDNPDFVLFDIDPHQSTFPNAVKVAKALHEILEEAGVDNFVKTSGKSGLHVLAPWPVPARPKPPATYDASRAWAIEIADRVAREMPQIATTERRIEKRGDRVYVDAMQNGRGKHVVPPYVLRPTPRGTVSMPLKWRELTAKLTPDQFDLKSATKRLAKWSEDPMSALTGR
jgi:bifunctional non-homologous end joining protein LigD